MRLKIGNSIIFVGLESLQDHCGSMVAAIIWLMGHVV